MLVLRHCDDFVIPGAYRDPCSYYNDVTVPCNSSFGDVTARDKHWTSIADVHNHPLLHDCCAIWVFAEVA